MKIINKKILNEDGFTLIELVVVLAILAMLAALAIPQFEKVLMNSKIKTDTSNCMLVETAVEVYRAETGVLPVITEADDKIKFNSLVTLLNKDGYLKNTEIKAQQTGKNFVYNETSGSVTLAPPSN
ncbi:MAG: prepilin-type N-terminal cleavage/methylation domain-containing protein [Eubacterium sp.]